MARIRLLHWKAAEAGDHLKRLREAGHEVDYQEQFIPALMKNWRESPPDAFVIDLSRLPSHGREIAIALRQSPRTRPIPIVFCGGEESKVARIQRDLPDATYCSLGTLRSNLRRALAHRIADPVKPTQMMDRYASRTAAQKLGIKESSAVLAINAPRDLNRVLGQLPAGVEIIDSESAAEPAPVTLCFVHNPHSLLDTVSRARSLAVSSKLWILWRKGGSISRGDLTETTVRQNATDLGLVDYKICAVNDVWSAMAFAPKR